LRDRLDRSFEQIHLVEYDDYFEVQEFLFAIYSEENNDN